MAVTDVTSVLVASYKPTVTGLLASTCPVRVPSGKAVAVAVGDSTGVEDVGVAVSTGVEEVGVAVSTGVSEVGVAVSTGVSDVGVAVSTGVSDVGVAVPTGVEEVGVGDSTGVEEVAVGDSAGVGVDVAVGAVPVTVRFVPVDGRVVRTLVPVDTRAVQLIAVCPACRPVTLNVKAGPLVVALLPLLPAIAKIKVPFCELLNAVAGSAPNKPAAATLLTATTFAS